jgi:hypothetical protein
MRWASKHHRHDVCGGGAIAATSFAICAHRSAALRTAGSAAKGASTVANFFTEAKTVVMEL